MILPTAVIEVQASNGDFLQALALLDTGAEVSVVRSDLVTALRLKRCNTLIRLTGVGGTPTGDCTHIVRVNFRPLRTGKPLLSVTAALLKNPTAYLARKMGISVQKLKLKFNSENGSNEGSVDLILGSDILGQVLNQAVELEINGPYALNTIFDHVMFGPTEPSQDFTATSSPVARTGLVSGATLSDQVERFWRSEEPPGRPVKDPSDILCEKLFSTTVTRGPDGKYTVRLPLIPNHQLGDTSQTALRRFLAIERRMERQPEYRAKYVEFMSEYINLGHMRLSNFNPHSNEQHYILSHHGVFKKSGDTNKIRVVFDGSVRSSNGVSLNDCLFSGERLQNDITDIIINFRLPLVVFTTDVKMMFRQTWVNSIDRKYQLIYWRASKSDPIQLYELTTNTYGLKSSPFIAIRCLHQLADDERHRYPRAARLLVKNSYVDDLNGGGDTLQEATDLRNELSALMNSAGYELRKWSSNDSRLLNGLPPDHLETPRTFDEPSDDVTGFVKILGIQWNPKLDNFTYRLELPREDNVTRRIILSTVARLFDPLGWVCPVVFRMKLLLQSLLGSVDDSRKIEWDAPASSDIVRQWLDITSDLPNLQRLSIPRCLKINKNARYTLHGFCDGSSLGFAAAVYVRTEHPNGSVLVRLLIAKTRVAPLKSNRTIPKLELSGATLLATLLNHVYSSSDMKFDEVTGWCDSTIVLAWLRTPPHKLQVFEGNRVAQITSSQVAIQWRHIPGPMNSADVASRGATAADLLADKSWWEPQWLCAPPDQWPQNCADLPTGPLPGLKVKSVHIGNTDSEFDLFEKYSSFEKLVNVTAYILRFGSIINRGKYSGINISVSERRNAISHLIRLVQERYFHEEILALRSDIPIKNSLRRLNLFIDKNDIIRVGGRIHAANLPYDARHQILLPGKCIFTELLVTYYHRNYCHCGANTLAAILSRFYWIISVRRITRFITFRCIPCYRTKARPTQPFMADLPADRIRQSRPFVGVGTDFAGPFFIKTSNLRNAKIKKCYLCVFVCLSSKAVHLEIVSDLTVEAFVAALTRFVSRRGLPSLIRSDCGTNFTGTDKHLKEIYIFLRDNHSDIERHLGRQEITWLFNAPSSPNHGGLFEAAVKSAKTHAKRVPTR